MMRINQPTYVLELDNSHEGALSCLLPNPSLIVISVQVSHDIKGDSGRDVNE